jgi:ABC-2 type transport system ATP-binding protein
MAELADRVVEITGPELRQVKEQVLRLAQVQSAAQQGMQLRVLLHAGGAGSAADTLRQQLNNPALQFSLARPSLEDVFVSCTTGGSGR